MALVSTCSKCGKPGFETSIEAPAGSNFKLVFIRCQSCGAVAGVTEFYNIGERLNVLAKKLNIRLDD